MGESVDISKITNVLIFKDGYYWLSINKPEVRVDIGILVEKEENPVDKDTYQIVPEEWELNNGFEFASDAYAYLRDLQEGRTK
jgi:hypothetical protein